jgi:UDPglucose 6-dehydrogenase
MKKKKISIIGLGYVGLITSLEFASRGHKVTGVDVFKEKVEKINSGTPPFYETGMDQLLIRVLKRKLFVATTNLEKAINESEITFICVGTPSQKDGSIDLKFVFQASKDIGIALKSKKDFHVVVVKSTVVPGTTEKVGKLIEEYSGKKVDQDFGICMNPEFLREGHALEDVKYPSRIVLGASCKKSVEILKSLYHGYNVPILTTNLKTAEMIKYAANAFLATKVSFINEVGNLCKAMGIDVYEVAKGIGLDPRISNKFMRAGCGFGGSCFPKDVKALVAKANELGYKANLLESVLLVNETQPLKLVELVEKKLQTLEEKKISILGLAFKPGTDDMREAPSIKIINTLLKKGCKIKAYDPKAMGTAYSIFKEQIAYCRNINEAIEDCDAILIVTEWPEFLEIENKLKGKLVFDGRRVINPKKDHGILLEGLCW